jgi:hypothetical protein
MTRLETKDILEAKYEAVGGVGIYQFLILIFFTETICLLIAKDYFINSSQRNP